MTNRNFNILGSPGFLIALSLLIANDFVFKEQFHNAFTGKLSDFAGVFVFSLFCMALFPRHKTLVCVSTAVLFAFWKSTHSQALIDGWNSLPLFGIRRTVDYSDLSALLVVPLAYSYPHMFRLHLPRRFVYPIAVIAIVAFTATSYSQKASFQNQYEFQTSKKELLERMGRLATNEVSQSFWLGDVFRVSFDSCNAWAIIGVEERVSRSVITLIQIENRCPRKVEPTEMREYFEKEFIDKLREEPVRKSAQISDIWSTSPAEPLTTPSP